MLGLEGGWRGWKLAKLAEQEGAWSLCFGGKSIFFHTQWMTYWIRWQIWNSNSKAFLRSLRQNSGEVLQRRAVAGGGQQDIIRELAQIAFSEMRECQ